MILHECRKYHYSITLPTDKNIRSYLFMLYYLRCTLRVYCSFLYFEYGIYNISALLSLIHLQNIKCNFMPHQIVITFIYISHQEMSSNSKINDLIALKISRFRRQTFVMKRHLQCFRNSYKIIRKLLKLLGLG